MTGIGTIFVMEMKYPIFKGHANVILRLPEGCMLKLSAKRSKKTFNGDVVATLSVNVIQVICLSA